jgi:hypothetical protein
VTALLASFLFWLATQIGTAIFTGGWTWVANSLPLNVLVVFVFAIVLFASMFLRYRQLHAKNRFGMVWLQNPSHEWVTLDQLLPYAGVLWTVRQFVPDWQPIGHREDSKTKFVNSFDIVTPPRCPECQTELEQKHQFFGGYRWECVQCGFKKRNRLSYYREADRALKILRREAEIDFERRKSE